MSRFPFIDISDTNCWMVYLMPFDAKDRTNYDLVNSFQQGCISKQIFGMGWDVPCFEQGTPMTKENADIYAEKYKEYYKQYDLSVSQDAITGYSSIKKGDYVVTRLKNGHYYVGRVASDGSLFLHKQDDPIYGLLSWGGKVEEWFEYSNDEELPSEIVGRFSQRLHSTIQKIAPYRQKMLVIAMYENRINKGSEPRFSIPKLRIGKNNFVRSLNYMELEDLVALYITNKHATEGYKLIPSSCKISQQNYEFRFVAKGRKPITCQVKNQKEIEIDHYLCETSYEKIYIFSGKWSDEFVDHLREEYKEYEEIYIIAPSELYPVLKEECLFKNDFYDFENDPVSPYEISLDGYVRKDKPSGEHDYSIDNDYICFVNGDGLFYSAEFGALVMSWDIFKDKGFDRKSIDDILEEINRKGC